MAITDTARQAQRKAQHWELVGSADTSYGVRHAVTNDAIVRYVIQNRWPLYGVTDAPARRSYISGIRRRLREVRDHQAAASWQQRRRILGNCRHTSRE